MTSIRHYFDKLKSKSLSRFEALYDLISFKEIFGYNEFHVTTAELKYRWNWKHHSRVLRFLDYLAQHRIITKRSDNKGIYIKLQNVY